MKDTQILSAFAELAEPRTTRPAATALVFDACHVGVVLRAVCVVEAVVAVAAMFMAASPLEWLVRLSVLTGGALPATLLWLICACSLKVVLANLPSRTQYLAGAALGAVAGLFCAAVLWLVGLQESAPWVASLRTKSMCCP